MVRRRHRRDLRVARSPHALDGRITAPQRRAGDEIQSGVMQLLVDGAPVQISISTRWVDAPSPIALLLGAVLGGVLLLLAAVLHRSLRSVLLAAAIAAFIVGCWQYRSIPADVDPPVVWWLLPAIAIVCTGVALVVRHRLAAQALAILAALELAAWLYERRGVAFRATIPTDAPYWFDRGVLAATAVTVVVLLVTELVAWRRPILRAMTADVVSDEAGLRERYRQPHPAVVAKVRPKIDPAAAAFVAASPLVVLATTSATGTDASPRGPPGFVKVLDPDHVAFADLSGNNRLDSYGNIVEHPNIGMLFLVPSVGETLRINGRATITTDPEVLATTAIDGVRPKVAVIVDVDECYIHCAKALRRSGVWDPATWLPPEERTSGAEVIVDQFQLQVTAEVVEADLEQDYQATLWVEGGR